MHIVVGDDQLGELGTIVIPLLDVVDSGGLHEVDAGPVIQASDECIIIVGKKELALDPHQHIPQADVVCLCKAVLPDILIVTLGGVVGRVEIEQARWAVILPDELLEVLVLNNYLTPYGVMTPLPSSMRSRAVS